MLPIFHGDARVMDLAGDQFGREGSGVALFLDLVSLLALFGDFYHESGCLEDQEQQNKHQVFHRVGFYIIAYSCIF